MIEMEFEYPRLHKGRESYSEFLCGLVKQRRSSGKVLDIGCSYGYLLKKLEENGFDTYGIDVSKESIEEAKKLTNAKLKVISAEARLPFESDFFDVITMFDVIEHIKNYETSLKEAYRILKKKGLLLIITPNSRSILRFLLGKNWSWYKDPTHVNIFSEKRLRAMLKVIGFKNLNFKTFFNFYIAGETTEFLKIFRPLRRIIFFPMIGDALFISAEKNR